MKKFHVALYFIIISAHPLFATNSSDRLMNPDVVEVFFDGIINTHMKSNNSPSGTIALVHNDRIIFQKGYGYQNIEEKILTVAEKTLFRPGSVSKLFTWTAVMQLKEQGKLDLDTDVNNYLKSFKIRDSFPGKPVTLRHILTHTPGFEDGGLGYLIITDINRALPLKEAMKKYQVERINPPGVQTAYSNYGTALAGLIISNISGMDFNTYINENILQPLGMNHSTFEEPLPLQLEENMAIGYAREAGRYVAKPFEIIRSFSPAGALSATSTDMARFARSYLNGGELEGNRILNKSTVEEMLTQNFSHDPSLPGMALGFYESHINGIRIVGHGGDTQYFHSDLAIDIENDLALFVSFSGTGGSKVRSVVVPAFYNEFFPKPSDKLSIPDDFGERASHYAGTYLFWRSNFSTIEKLINLGGGIKVAPSEDNTLIVSGFEEAKQFVEIGEDLFREKGGETRIAFQKDEKGEITGLTFDFLPFMSTYKASTWKTQPFNLFLLGFSMIVFLGVLLRLGYQWSAFKSLPQPEKEATRASVFVSALTMAFLVVGIIAFIKDGDKLFSEGVTTLFKFWLIFPILATLAGLYQLYQTVLIWQNGYWGIWKNIRFTIVTFCSLFMAWFYYYWNLLGYNYM